jgi:hypothetical protein
MGCDIHCMIEYKCTESYSNYYKSYSKCWDSFGFHSINPGRNYRWFANLAGVRGEPKGGEPLASGFGIPADASYATKSESTIFVKDDNRTTIEQWLSSGIVKWADWSTDLSGRPDRVTHPDYHTYGWCDVKAWKKSVRGAKTLEIKCMNAIIDTLIKNKCEVRVVFWFDN